MRKLVTSSLIAVGFGVVVLVGLVYVAQIRNVNAQAHGDTPVVLVGGSVTLGEHSSSGSDWSPATTPGTSYTAPAASAISAIVVKATPSDPDADSPNDRLHINVPMGNSWKIDILTSQLGNTKAVTITPSGSNIVATANTGQFCHVGRDLRYSHNSNCPNPNQPDDTFSSVIVTINEIQIGNLNCNTGTLGLCKIVLETP
jgi:hypothetical protein